MVDISGKLDGSASGKGKGLAAAFEAPRAGGMFELPLFSTLAVYMVDYHIIYLKYIITVRDRMS